MDSLEPSVAELIAALDSSTAALAHSVASLTSAQVEGPCTLPGWSRGHLLTHLARNADGLRNLLVAARTGEPLRMYASGAARNEDIRVGATRSVGVIVDDHTLSYQALTTEIAHLPDNAWSNPVVFHTTTGPQEKPASAIIEMRLREVEIHHVDLDTGYDFRTAKPDTVDLLLRYAIDRQAPAMAHGFDFTATDTGRCYIAIGSPDQTPVAVSGPAHDLLRYLTGRAGPVASLADLPAAPAWG